MKLFFDLPGFVFVVGVDEDVVERAIRSKFMTEDDAPPSSVSFAGGEKQSASTTATQRLGREYIKKIFQVPYALPAMMPEQLDDLLKSMYDEAGLDMPQLKDLQMRLRPYIGYVAVERRVNPREVKRFINAYTLQTLVRPELDRDTVLALQTLAFRYEWEMLYDAILADSALFIDALSRYREGQETVFEELSPELRALPSSLATYLLSSSAEPLTRHKSLDTYLSSLQSISRTQSWFFDAYRQAGQLRRDVRNALDQQMISPEIAEEISGTVAEALQRISSVSSNALRPEEFDRLEFALSQTNKVARELSGKARDTEADDAAMRPILTELGDTIQNVISEIRRLRDSSTFLP
jgi:KAP family P-loop domain